MPEPLSSLLPCPFCGGEAIRDVASGSGVEFPYRVGCFEGACRCSAHTFWCATQEAADESWNTRAATAPPTPRRPVRWTCEEAGEIRERVARVFNLSVDDVTQQVDELLFRLVYERDHPSRLLDSVAGVVRFVRGHGVIHNAYIETESLSEVAHLWLYDTVNGMQMRGEVEEGQPVRITITAEPWPSSLPVPEPEEYKGREAER